MFDMEVYTKTDIGLVRKENQDSSAYSIISPDCVWAVICDGMGGANGGKTASSAAVNFISEYIANEYHEDMSEEALSEMLIAAVDGANLKVYKLAIEDYDLAGMGTTCDLVFVRNEIAHVVHVGDSRTYAIRVRNVRGRVLRTEAVRISAGALPASESGGFRSCLPVNLPAGLLFSCGPVPPEIRSGSFSPCFSAYP